MNADQIAFNRRYIRDAQAQIAQLKEEMANPRARAAKNRTRAAVIVSARGRHLDRGFGGGEDRVHLNFKWTDVHDG
ncbi:hypothetical protein LFL97_31965 [Burkholderia sp. JSH-S8]|nr:hypothetical protein LFL97_31965 [Burkholderia sp. JSH-S8]